MSIEITNIREFQRELRRAMESVGNGAETVLKGISFEVFKGLQIRTPWETRRAAGGWNMSLNRPSEWKPPEGGSYYSLQNINLNRITLRTEVNISNNVEYITPLDEGWSRRASTGIVNYVLARSGPVLAELIRRENERDIP